MALKVKGGSHKPRDIGSLKKLEKARKQFPVESPEEDIAMATS